MIDVIFYPALVAAQLAKSSGLGSAAFLATAALIIHSPAFVLFGIARLLRH